MRHLRITFFSLVAFLGIALGAIFALPLYRKDFARVDINGVSLAAEVAEDEASQSRGLSGREGIDPQDAMLFSFGRADRYAIWMKGMKFPIDIFWIKNGTVADLEENVPPPEPGTPDVLLPVYRPDVPSEMVLETGAGFAGANGVHIGDPVKITLRGTVFAKENNESTVKVSPVLLPPGQEYFIETLRAHPVRGDGFQIGKTLEVRDMYQKFSFVYRADARTLSGVMNVPTGPVPPSGFPLLILNHGLIRPEIYFSGRGSKREQDFFARHGYVTIHPDYRGYSSTSPVFPEHHDFYQGYTDDVIALLDALTSANHALIDLHRIGMWGHSMGGGIAARVAVLRADIRAFVLFAPISADVEDNFYELSAEEIGWLHETYGPAGGPVYRKMSPISYFSDVSSPVQLHHGGADDAVPIGFSEKMFAALQRNGKKAEFFTYPGEAHEFVDAWPLAVGRALQFFDRYVKGAR